MKLRSSLLSEWKLTSAARGDWWICHGNTNIGTSNGRQFCNTCRVISLSMQQNMCLVWYRDCKVWSQHIHIHVPCKITDCCKSILCNCHIHEWPWHSLVNIIHTCHSYQINYPNRDGMIKRPGHESYLRKLIEEERRAYSEELVAPKSPMWLNLLFWWQYSSVTF